MEGSIKMGGTCFRVGAVLSYENREAFVAAQLRREFIFRQKKESEREKMLCDVWDLAHGQEPEPVKKKRTRKK